MPDVFLYSRQDGMKNHFRHSGKEGLQNGIEECTGWFDGKSPKVATMLSKL